MALAPGTRVGPYEVLAPLGAGGMGEVYRALDPRLGREVALKVLPSAVAQDADRLRRFEVESRAAGALNHPALLAVFDVGEDAGLRYVVSELLDGETLRARLGAGGLPPRKAIEYAIQVAHGLSAAHEKGIIHRDLKPENLFVTRDGRAKILDFGLAKLVEPPAAGADEATQGRDATATGMVLGTAGYMSPEQVRGLPADDRSDIFAFGCVLYEILGGRRAFRGDTAAEAMTAVLREDPPSLDSIDPTLPPAVDRVVKRCLEKRSEERFQSARDVAFALEALSTTWTRTSVSTRVRRPRRSVLAALAVAAVIAAVAALGFAYGKDRWAAEMPDYTQLTFRRGTIWSARFAPDGQTIVYGAAWEGKPPELFSTRPDGRESRPLGITNATVLSISASEMAIGVEPQFQSFFPVGGSLARVPLGGGAPRVVLDDVSGADWSPDGTQLAVVRQVEGRWRIEFPIGTVLYETDAFLAYPSVSPAGDAVAFLEFSARDPGVSMIAVVDRSGHKRALTGQPVVMGRPFWHRGTGNLWFRTMGEAEGNHGGSTNVYDTTPAGHRRLVTRLPGDIHIEDMAADGRLLIHRSMSVGSMFARTSEGAAEVDLSWLDASTLADVSPDGKLLVFTETMAGGRPNYGVYMRRTDGSPAVRLGDGRAYALSPDGKWVLATITRDGEPRIVLLPTGAGSPRTIPNPAVIDFRGGTFFPDSRRLVYAGNVPGQGPRLFVSDTDGAAPRAIGPADLDVEFPVVSPDGRMVAAANAEGEVFVVPLEGGEPLTVSAAEPGELPIQWSSDSRSLYVYRPDEIPARIYQVSVMGAERRLFRQIPVLDHTGLDGRMTVVMTADGNAYAYSFLRRLSELYLATGLR